MAEIPRQLLARSDVSTASRLVLVALWTYASHDEPEPFVWPSAGTLAEWLGLDERSVWRRLGDLRKVSLIRREWRGVGGRQQNGWVLADPRDHSVITGGQERHGTLAFTSGHIRPTRAFMSEDPDINVRRPLAKTPVESLNESTKNPPQDQCVLTIPETPKKDAKAQIRELWRWWEDQLCHRKYRRKPKGLSDPARKSVEKLLSHIRQTLECSLDEAIGSQREHLSWRLLEAPRDPGTRDRIGSATPWRTAWWDWWHDKVANRADTPDQPDTNEIVYVYDDEGMARL